MKRTLTTNQLILLLELLRGTTDIAKVSHTTESDLVILQNAGLISGNVTTQEGEAYCEAIKVFDKSKLKVIYDINSPINL